ncbi:MAG: LPS export ABC transporter periplasmic protein LptC [Spirosomataceae bacterium]
MKLIRTCPLLLRGGFFLGLLLLLFSCEEENKKSNELYKGPDMEIDNIVGYYSDSAKVVVRMETAKQITLQNRDRVYPKEIRLFFFDKLGNETSTLRADSGHFFNDKNEYKVWGKVFVYNKVKQESLQTNELTWTPQNQKVFTDTPVTVKNKDEVLYGKGLTAKQDFSEYVVRSVTGIVRAPVSAQEFQPQ